VARRRAAPEHRNSSRTYMIVPPSNRVPRATPFKRFPIPRNLGVSASSSIVRGRTCRH
jgi:hypothetical protein